MALLWLRFCCSESPVPNEVQISRGVRPGSATIADSASQKMKSGKPVRSSAQGGSSSNRST